MSEQLKIAQLEEELAKAKETIHNNEVLMKDYQKHIQAMRKAARIVKDEICYLTGEEW